eukprot:scaffold135008_cov19-Tisochrysis_lutea.AAC.2
MLHSQLVRLGCCCPPLALPILHLLVRSLEWVPLGTDADRCAPPCETWFCLVLPSPSYARPAPADEIHLSSGNPSVLKQLSCALEIHGPDSMDKKYTRKTEDGCSRLVPQNMHLLMKSTYAHGIIEQEIKLQMLAGACPDAL